MRRSALFLLALIPTLASPACSSESTKDEPVTPAPGVASAEIGPEGGELAPDESSGFAGFALEIPPGALAAKTTVTFQGVMDLLPLPETAERVGPQVRILPEGTVLAKPARLTVPMDHELRSRFEAPPAECKVWAREGDGWKRLEAVASTPDSVTVEIQSFAAAAAAGVFAKSLQPTCTTCGLIRPIVPTEPACTDPSGYCVVELPSPPDPDVFLGDLNSLTSTVANGALYYVDAVSRGTLNPDILVKRYEILELAQRITRYAITNVGALVGPLTITPVQLQDSGPAWVTFGGFGTVRFPTTGLTTRFDPPGNDPQGGTVRPDGVAVAPSVDRPIRFVSTQGVGTPRSFFSVADSTRKKMFDGVSTETIAVRPVEGGPQLVVRSSKKGLCTMTAGNGDPPICTPRTDLVTLPVASYGAFISSTTFGTAAASPASEPPAVGWRPANGGPQVSFTPPAGIAELAFDDDGRRLYGINTLRAELYIMDRTSPGGVQTLRLTAADHSSRTYYDHTPRRILALRGRNELLIVTTTGSRAATFLRIRKSQ